MELWRYLIISGLYNEDINLNCVNDKTLGGIVESKSYKILYQIKQIVDDKNLLDQDCFLKIEKIIRVLEENNIFCNRHN